MYSVAKQYSLLSNDSLRILAFALIQSLVIPVVQIHQVLGRLQHQNCQRLEPSLQSSSPNVFAGDNTQTGGPTKHESHF